MSGDITLFSFHKLKTVVKISIISIQISKIKPEYTEQLLKVLKITVQISNISIEISEFSKISFQAWKRSVKMSQILVKISWISVISETSKYRVEEYGQKVHNLE